MKQEGMSGCKTILDIPPAYLSAKSGEELRKNLLKSQKEPLKAAKEPAFDQSYLRPVSAADRYRAEVSIAMHSEKTANGIHAWRIL